MLNSEGQAATHTLLVSSISTSTTAGASSSTTYIDVRGYEGDLVFLINPGAITGSCTPDIQDATDTSGTGTASIAANEGAYTALAANTVRKYTIKAKSTRGFIRLINTVVTGPVLISASMLARPKNF
jgi:hypothetical protein